MISQLIPLAKHETLICTTSWIEKRTALNVIEATDFVDARERESRCTAEELNEHERLKVCPVGINLRM